MNRKLRSRGRNLLLLLLIHVVVVARETGGASAFDIDLDYPESSWEEEERVIIEQGRNKSFSCRVSNVQFFDVVRVRLTQGNKTLIISDNGDIKEPFGHMPRYRIHYDFVQDSATVSLSYHGILGEDSGVLSCQKMSSSSFALLELIVLVPPTAIQMYHLHMNTSSPSSSSSSSSSSSLDDFTEEIIQDGGFIQLEEKETQGIRCSASVVSSTRAPWVKMMIDGSELDLQPVERVRILPPIPPSLTSTPVPQELTRYESTGSIIHTVDAPSALQHGKVVTCTARTDKIFEPLRVSAVIVVRFQPVITCPVTSYEARNGENVTMVCQLESNPESKVKWSSVNRERQLHHDKHFSFQTQPIEAKEKSSPPSSSSSSSSSQPNFSSSSSSKSPLVQSSMATGRKQVMMTITRIKESHFGSYAVTATNDLGRSQVELTLSKMAPSHVTQTNHKQVDRPSKQQQSPRTLHRPKGYYRSSGASSRDWSLPKCFLLVSTVTTGLTLSWTRETPSSS